MEDIFKNDEFRITVLLKQRQRKLIEDEARKQQRKFSPMLRIIIDEWAEMKKKSNGNECEE